MEVNTLNDAYEEPLKSLLTAPDHPTAMLVSDDILAVVLEQFCGKLGLRVPKDLSIVSFNNSLFSRITSPQLTTVDVNPYQLGMEAAAQNDLKPTRGEIISFIDQTPQLADVLAASRAFRSQSGDMLTSSMFASLWWTFAHIDTDAADRFFMSLASGANLQADDPILILRNTLMAQPHKAGRSTRDNRVRIAALTIKAWNKWRKGKPLRQLKFSAGESFPTPL